MLLFFEKSHNIFNPFLLGKDKSIMYTLYDNSMKSELVT